VKKLRNTLYIATQGAYLAREGESLLVRVEQQTRLRVPILALESIVCFGRITCSPGTLALCSEHGVPISHLSPHGRFIARVEGPVSGNVLLRREQYRRADAPEASARIAAAVVAAKIANGRAVLLRAARDRPEAPGARHLQIAAEAMAHVLSALAPGSPLDVIRGAEGRAGHIYFDAFDHLITQQKDAFTFRGRNRRPPLDNVNALLSFVYTLLVHDVASALASVGLDPAVGFLHRDRPGRPSLALDLMEEFRACVADRLVLSLINRRQIRGRDFRTTETGAVRMNDAARKTVLTAYQKRKQEQVRHPFLEETVPVGLLFHCQALLLARHLRGDLDGYPPYFAR